MAKSMLEEIIDVYDRYVNPEDDLIDPTTGERWTPLGMVGDKEERIGVPTTEMSLKTVREQCRELAASNPYAVNGHENRVNYIVGSGHVYDVKWRKLPTKATEAEEEGDKELDSIRDAIRAFVETNRWQWRQQEIVRRIDRDGECFIRTFIADGTLKIRFVEPYQVAQPSGNLGDTFGIQTDPLDVETVKGYWIDGRLVDASEIQHRKANVDCNVKRGLPLFWPVRKNLRRAEKLLRNMSVVAEIQSAIAIIRKHGQATQSGVESFIASSADATVTNQTTGKTTQYRRYGPGTILDSSVNTEYEFPARGIDAGKYVAILQAELRAIASRLVMPEFMLTSDASNANYSSTMVAEGPAVKQFQRLQYGMIEEDIKLIRMALLASGISDNLLDRVEIIATPPNVQSRDKRADADTYDILRRNRAVSVQTMMEAFDLDPVVEEDRLASEGPMTVDVDSQHVADPLADPNALAAPQPTDAEPGKPIANQQVQTSQELVLNGAQIQAALSIVTSVAAGDMPRDAGVGQLQVLFNLTPQQAEQIMGSAGTNTPTTPNPNPAKEKADALAAEVASKTSSKPVDEATKARAALWEAYP